MHMAEYTPFGWLSLKTFMPATAIGFATSILFSLAYAASDEMHQSFVPGREESIWDWTADAIGVLISGYMYYIYKFKKKRIS